ncbi:MAG TPA: threonine synthase [Terriglobales bacterium]|nr:threonine synthase [Terriglobales bacterium]
MKTASLTPVAADHLLRCVHCGTVQASADRMFRCASCSELLEVTYPEWADAGREFGLRLREIWRERRNSTLPEDASGVWRFRDLLPRVAREHIVTMSEGNTPLVELPKAARDLGLTRVLAKHQGMNPTGSFKDTGVSMAISIAKSQGYSLVCCASTGNTSASVAAYAARAGMKSIVLLPQGQVASGKLAQALEYGAHVLQLKTDFDGCLKVLNEVVRKFPTYLMNSLNPYRLEGQKTLAFELMEQLNWNVPDHVIVPGGNLANSSAIGKGFLELQQLGLIARLPKISIIQAQGANPLVRSMRESGGESLIPVTPQTRATAIRIGNPASWRKAVAILKHTAGACEEVTEQEIAAAKAELGAQGVGCEPASAASFAGLKNLVRAGFVKAEETAVLVLTGHMLKDVDYMLEAQSQRMPRPIAAESSDVICALEKINAGN